jgi:hypothetical protein
MVATTAPRRSLMSRLWPWTSAPSAPVALAKSALKPPKSATRPIGHDGIARSGGRFIDENVEHNRDLDMGEWRGTSSRVGAGRRIAKEDDDVRGIVYSYTHALLGTSWDVIAADDSSADAVMLAHAFEGQLMGPRRREWPKRLLDAMLCFRDGVRLQERVVWRDNQLTVPRYEQAESGEWVKGTGGRKGWYAFDLQPRLPHSIDQWITAEDGSFGGVIQWWDQGDTHNYSTPTIPAENLLRWSYDEEGSNWEGDPLIRSCWSRAMTRKRIQLLAEIGFNRHAGGTPLIKEIEPGYLKDQDWTDLRDIAREYAQHQNQFLEVPYGGDFSILEAKMEFAKSMAEWWKMLGLSMCRAAGCMHLYTGESNGTQALFGGQRDLFLYNAGHLAEQVIGPYNDLAVDWTRWNGFSEDLAPTLTYGDLIATDMGKVAADWKTAREAGAFHPTIEDEVWWREQGGYPDGGQALTDVYEVQGAGATAGPEGAAQDTALNGAQVTAATAIVSQVVAGTLPKNTARAMLIEFFNLSEDAADAILADVEVTEPDPDPDGDGEGVAASLDLTKGGTVTFTLASDGPKVHRCCCGHIAMADESKPRVAFKPGMTPAEYVAQCGPMHALAEETFDAPASRIDRDEITAALLDEIRPLMLATAEPYAEALAGADMAEAADLTVSDEHRDAMIEALAKGYRLTREQGQVQVQAEVAAQEADPDFPAKLAAAMAAEGMSFADRVEPLDEITGDQLDLWERAAATTTTDALLQDIEQAGKRRHQETATTGTSAAPLLAGIVADVNPDPLVKGDVNGAQANGRAVQMRASDVAYGIYTLTPELGGKDGGGHTPCIACQFTASDPRSPFLMSDLEEVAWFDVPSPRCYGGSTCYCTIIGLTAPPPGVRR